MILCPEDMASLISAGNLSPALKVIDALESRGEVWIVGGAVRDALLGISSEDLDMACRLSPAETTGILESIGSRNFRSPRI